MDDDNFTKIMSTLGLNFNPAETAIKSFEARVASLNKQIFDLKANSIAGAKDINAIFSSQLGSMGSGTKTIFDQFGQPLKTVQTEAAKASTSMGNMSASYLKTTKVAKEHGQAVQDVAKKYSILGSEYGRRSGWFLSGALFYGGINAAKEAVQTISEVESGVTDIARVMEDSNFVFKDYRDELLQLGVDYGQTFDKVQDIALRWAQAGYNVKDSLEATKSSLLALNTAELDASGATEDFIGIMAQWQLEISDLPLLLDRINKTADDFTVTSQDLSDGLLRSSGAAKIMGLSIEQTISLLTVMREASGRTGRETGSALNSILSYVQRPIAIKTLEGLGIQVFADAAKTQFRNVMEIFQDVASRWGQLAPEIQDGFVKSADDAGLFNEELAAAIGSQQEWNDLQQRDISQAAAGVYRRNYFIGMIERLTGAQKVLNGMTDAAGYSQTENARTMDTLEKKYESLKTACQELAVTLGDAGLLDILKGLTETATNAADSIAKLDPNLKALLFTSLEILAVAKGIKAIGGLFGAEATFGALLKVLPGWTKLLAIIPLVAGAIGLFVNNAKAASGEMSEQEKALGKLSEQYLQAKSKLSNLQSGTDEYNATQSEMHRLMNEIIQKNPNLIEGYDSATQTIKLNEGALTGAKTAYEKLDEAIANHVSNITSMTDEQITQDKKSLTSTIETIKGKLKAYNEELNFYKNNPQKDNALVDTMTKAGYGDVGEWISKNILGVLGGAGYGEEAAYILGKGVRTEDVKKQISDSNSKLLESLANLDQISKEQEDRLKKAVENKPGGGSGLSTEFSEKNLKSLLDANKISLQRYLDELRKLKKDQYSEYLNKSAEELNKMLSDTTVINSTTGETAADKTKAYLSLENAIQGAADKSSKNTPNEAYQAQLTLLEHRKKLGQETTQREINDLSILGIKYHLNAQERMDLEERIFDAGQKLKDDEQKAKEDRLQNSINWIKQEEEFGKLSAKETLAAWERVKTQQKDNAEAVKAANKGSFDTYKEMLQDQQKDIEKAYNGRIDQIEAEAKKQKDAQDELIKGYEKQQKALDRSESTRDYDTKMADLKKDLAYWSIRTGEDARKKVAELNAKIAEEEHDRDIELQKQSLDDQKQAAQDKKDQIDKDAEAQKTVLKTMWIDIQDIFNDNNLNLIANAAKTSKAVSDEYQKILDKIKEVMTNGKFVTSPDGTIDLQGGEESLGGAQGATLNTQIKALAEKIVSLKYRYDQGDKTAAIEAISVYNQLQELGSKGQTTAEQLRKMGYAAAEKYVEGLPKLHGGGETLSYGMAYVKPGEFFFPPTLSTDLKTLIAVSSGITGKVKAGDSYSTTDKRVINNFNAPIFNSEKTSFEDETDMTIFAREVARAIETRR